MLLATYHVDPDVLPCPGEEYKHDIYGGFNRKTEDDHPAYREFCRNLSRRIIEKILRYRRECPKGRYFGIVGMDASPTCSVKEIGPNKTGKGVLIQELERELKKINIVLPMVGWSPHDPFVYDRFEEVRKLIEAGYGNINGK